MLITFSIATDKDSVESKFKLIGKFSYQGGQVKSGTYKNYNDIKNYWYQKVFTNIGVEKKIKNWLTITVAIEANMKFSFKDVLSYSESKSFRHDIYIDQSRGDISLVDNELISLQLTLGYFHFVYNKDVQNLGNYLFRSSCYPAAIIPSELDFPYSRLCGLDFRTSFLDGNFFNDFIISTHLENYPPDDFSIADILGFYFRGIKAGIGIQFDRVMEISDAITSPQIASMVNPENNNEIFYTFAGTKFMTWVNLDIKKIIFGENYPSILGENDGKLFFEMNILGLKNYYYFYEKRKERIPLSFGFLLPTFKLLDVLSLEFEYFGSPYPNSTDRPLNSNTPFPEINPGFYDPAEYKDDDWKWSIYAKRSFSNFSIIAQIARDHLQLWSMRSADKVFHDNLVDKDDYYYQLKFQFNF